MRYTCILPKKIDKMLTELSENQETTKSEIVRKALYTYNRLINEEGNIYIINGDDVKELIII